MGPVEKYIIERIRRDGTVHMTLIDPEKVTASSVLEIASAAEEAGTSAIMVGGSTATAVHQTDEVVKGIKRQVKVPLILFPSNVTSISRFADAIWFMSLLNSTNPYFMTGAQALGAPLIKQYGLEPLPSGYIIVGEGGVAAFIGQAHPIPFDKPEVAMIYALAAQYFGMRFVYLEAGSGAKQHAPPEMVAMVRRAIDIPLIVGGGIRDAADAEVVARAGADIVVTGTLVEVTGSDIRERLGEMVRSVRLAAEARRTCGDSEDSSNKFRP